MARRGGRRAGTGAGPAGVQKGGDAADKRHKMAIVRCVTIKLIEAAGDGGADEKEIAKRAHELLHAEYSEASKVARKTVLAHLRKMRDKGSVADEPRSGRPPALTPTQVGQACRHFEGGFKVKADTPAGATQWFGFTSITHAMMEECPNSDKLRKLWSNSGLTLRGFWEALCRHKGGKGFKKVHLNYNKSLDPSIKKERVQESKFWASLSKEDLERTVYADEKAMWLTGAQSYECYAPENQQDEEREGLLDIRDSFKIKFLSAVNAKLGGIFFGQISGSMAFETPWEVRT